MLPSIPVPSRRLDDYREIVGDEPIEALRTLAADLAGLRVLNINSTAFGGGVAELLLTQVGLMNDLGIDASWHVLAGSDEFFAVTKFAHNGLQGVDVPWDAAMSRTYEDRIRAEAAELASGLDHDLVLVHDPQPVGLLAALEDGGMRRGTWVWRCHLDLSRPDQGVWSFFAPLVARYDRAVFTMPEFVPAGIGDERVAIIPPSIDPLSAKNQWIDPDTIYEILHRFGVDWTRPIVTQVSRFDPWKDPVGVIEAYRLASDQVEGLQLVLIGSMAHDDPEAWHYLELTERHRDGDPNVFLLSNLNGVGTLEVNAFQRDSDVVVQKSLREGFGLTVAEALWKGTPVIGGNVGGIRLQIEDGVSGYLVDSMPECAERLVQLLGDEDLRSSMAEAGRRRVRERFLCVRELSDLLGTLSRLASRESNLHA